jgi:hypothetical protein
MHYPLYDAIFVTLIISPSIQAQAFLTIYFFANALCNSQSTHLYTNTSFRLSPILHNFHARCKSIYDLSLSGVTPHPLSPCIPCLKTNRASQTSWSLRPAPYCHRDQRGATPQTSPPIKFRPRKPRIIRCAWAVVIPPISGVPVPGA